MLTLGAARATSGPCTEPVQNVPFSSYPDTASTPGREAEIAHLRSIVGLVWRSVVLWMVLLALLTLARLLG